MSKAQHTPGPWVYGIQTGKIDTHRIYGPQGREMICDMRNDSNDTEHIAANARLIAAAPDLLDALHSALPFVEDALEDHCYKPGSVRKVLATIHAAIYKATGE